MKHPLSLLLLAFVGIGRAQTSCMPPPPVAPMLAYPAGTIIPGVGTSDIPVTTKSEKARQLTKQGFALIHCFWFNEAARSFRDATKEDPSCAIAWMGRYVSLTLPWYNPSENEAEADYAIKRAVETCGSAGDLEQAMIAACRARSVSKQDLDGEFETELRKVIDAHPTAFEPRLLLAAIRTQLCMGAYDPNLNPQAELTKVLALVDPILKKDPNNPGALHYRIHALEGSRPDLAVKTADLLTINAPASGHMVHMPGHIYNRVGMYEKARESFANSMRIHEAYAKSIPGATPNVDWNYSHDTDYLIFNLSEMGRIKEAEALLKDNPGSWEKLAWRAGQWKKLSEKSPSPFFNGMADIESGDLQAAAQEAEKLGNEAKEAIPANAGRYVVSDIRMKRIKAGEVQGLLLSRQGKHAEAEAKLADAVSVFELLRYDEPPDYARTPYETQGEIEIAAGNYDAAIKAYVNGLRQRPNSGWMLYGIALAHEKAGHEKEARKGYQAFLKAWPTADSDLPQVVQAKAYLAAKR